MRRVAVLAILILAACGGEDQPVETFAPAPTLTSAATTAPPASESTTPAEVDSGAASDTTTTTTTTSLPTNAAPEFGLSQVVFGEAAFVVITNWGNTTGSLDGIWLSQRTAFQALPDVTLEPAGQALIGLTGQPPPDLAGMAAIVDLGPAVGGIDPAGGEIGMHRGDAFNDPTSLIAYVAWGDGPHDRIGLATSAGLWDGVPVEVFDDAPSISTGLYPATSSSDWSPDIGG